MLGNVVKNWVCCFCGEEEKEVEEVVGEGERNGMGMKGREKGVYEGRGWLFNNDELMKDSGDYDLMINMGCVGCEGVESGGLGEK